MTLLSSIVFSFEFVEEQAYVPFRSCILWFFSLVLFFVFPISSNNSNSNSNHTPCSYIWVLKWVRFKGFMTILFLMLCICCGPHHDLMKSIFPTLNMTDNRWDPRLRLLQLSYEHCLIALPPPGVSLGIEVTLFLLYPCFWMSYSQFFYNKSLSSLVTLSYWILANARKESQILDFTHLPVFIVMSWCSYK